MFLQQCFLVCPGLNLHVHKVWHMNSSAFELNLTALSCDDFRLFFYLKSEGLDSNRIVQHKSEPHRHHAELSGTGQFHRVDP
jgi:hypothetical protein